GNLDFHSLGQQICKHLFEASNHPNIKGGELYVVYLRNVQLEGVEHEAIGIFKSESKEPFLKVSPIQGSFEIAYEPEAININKLDNGSIIINTEREEGYKVLANDHTNWQQEYAFMKDTFVSLCVRYVPLTKTLYFLQV